MDSRERNYIFHEYTESLCPACMERIPAKIIIRDGSVYILKKCKTHGQQEELLEEDAEYHLRKREYDKPGTASIIQTGTRRGCPFDCGLCPEHDQHSCIGLIEVTNHCNLGCEMCFADAGHEDFLSMSKIEEMMDFYQDTEGGKAEILQISGGEPTIHPDILQIIKMAKSKRFKYVMLNTNGLRIAEDESFVRELQQFTGGFEVYLQFDGFEERTHMRLRGRELSGIKERAVSNLEKYHIPTTLVCTVENGVNDHELGEIITFGIRTKYIRGVNFQPVVYFGRNAAHAQKAVTLQRATLSGVLKQIEKQTSGMLKKSDFIPLPCNVERVAITYLYRSGQEFVPITRNSKIREYLPIINNTFAFTVEDALKDTGKVMLKPGNACCCMNFLKDFRQLVPLHFHLKPKEERIEYVNENTFRISVTSFIDAYNFDMKSMQKECVHVVTPDLKRIPFSSYNMLYRNGTDRSSLADCSRDPDTMLQLHCAQKGGEE